MRRALSLGLGLLCLGLVAGRADSPAGGGLRFKPGQVLTYRLELTTRASDTRKGAVNEMSSRVEQTKRWQVLNVDDHGVATLQLTLTRLAMTQRLPGGQTWAFDSDHPDQGDKPLRDQLTPHVNRVLAVLRVDPTGRVVEVTSSQAPASQFEREPPFGVLLSAEALAAGKPWARAYKITVEPPLGTGEKYAAEQTYQGQAGQGDYLIQFATRLPQPPAGTMEKMPLLQMQPRGRALYDPRAGVVTVIEWTSGGAIDGHQGEGSRYELQCDCVERLVAN